MRLPEEPAPPPPPPPPPPPIGPYGVLWHVATGRVNSEVFDDLGEAQERFAKLKGGPYAAMMADSMLKEMHYYGGLLFHVVTVLSASSTETPQEHLDTKPAFL